MAVGFERFTEVWRGSTGGGMLDAVAEGEGGTDEDPADPGKGCERPSNWRPLPLPATGGGGVARGRGSGEPVRGDGLSAGGAEAAAGAVSGEGALGDDGTAVLSCRPLRL